MSTNDIQRTINVTGVGRVTAAADLLTLSLTVETQAPTVSEALAENNKQAEAVLSTLKAHGIQERDIQTTEFSINPVTDNGNPPKIVRFRTRNGLSAKLRDLQAAGAVIDAAVQAGGDATRIENISFSFADPSNLFVEARKRAIADAKDRAQQLANGLDVGLGNIISISESDFSGPTIRAFSAFASSTPILSGESEVSLQVTVSYGISTK
jgi:uncharacterized protein